MPHDIESETVFAPGEKVDLIYANPRWQCSVDEVLKLDFLQEDHIQAEGEGADALAARISEFLKLWCREHLDEGREFAVSPLPAKVAVCVQSGVPASISIQDGRVLIRGALPEVATAVAEFLFVLEEKYPCDMPFGKQQPTSPLDWAATPRQTRFLKQSGLVGKPMSVQKIARDFRAFLQENKIQPAEGF